MEGFSVYLYEKSVGLSFIIILILLTRALVFKKINPQITYQLWLVIPFYLALPNIDVWFTEYGHAYSVNNSQVLDSTRLPSIETYLPASNMLYLFWFWLIGSLISLTRCLIGYQSFLNSISPIEFNNKIDLIELVGENSIRRVNFFESDTVSLAAAFGVLTKNILLPAQFRNLSKLDQEIIIRHELVHLARYDEKINLLRQLLKCVFWFCPFIYLADRCFEEDQEMSCDTQVLSNQEKITEKDYALALINLSATTAVRGLFSQWNYSKLIKRRIIMLKPKASNRWTKLLMFSFVMTASLSTSMLVAMEDNSVTEAIPLYVHPPVYPTEAASKNISGRVDVQFKLDGDGRPFDTHVVDSEPKDIFDQSSLDAIKKWKFKTVEKGMIVHYVLVYEAN